MGNIPQQVLLFVGYTATETRLNDRHTLTTPFTSAGPYKREGCNEGGTEWCGVTVSNNSADGPLVVCVYVQFCRSTPGVVTPPPLLFFFHVCVRPVSRNGSFRSPSSKMIFDHFVLFL